MTSFLIEKWKFILLIAAVFMSFSASDLKAEQKKILVIHSYNQGNEWVTSINKGIESSFLHRSDVDLYYTYLDSKRFPLSRVSPFLSATLREKFSRKKPDLIITADNNAFDFMKNERKDFLSDIPLVFCGVNFPDSKTYAGMNNFTGVAEVPNVQSTLDIALRLFPDTKGIAVISDSTPTGKLNAEYWQKIAPLFKSNYSVTELFDLNYNELKNGLKNLGDKQVILLLALYRTRDEVAFTAKQGIQFIRSNCSLPIFGNWDFVLNTGAVGGMLINGFLQGQHAAEKCLQILSGTPVDDVQIQSSSPATPGFDYKVLQEFKIDLKALPPKSHVVNKPQDISEKYAHFIPLLLIAILALIVLILFMAGFIYWRRSHELALLKSEQQFRHMADCLPLAVQIFDQKKNKFTYVNQSFTEIFGYTLEDIANPDDWFIKAYPDRRYRQKIKEAFNSYLAGPIPKKTHKISSNVTTSNGEKRAVIFHSTGLEKNKRLRLLIDETQRLESEQAIRKHLAAIQASADGIAIYSDQMKLSFANLSFARIFGFSDPEVLMESSLNSRLAPMNSQTKFEISESLKNTGTWKGESIGVTIDKNEFPIEMTLTSFSDRGVVCIVRNISERKQEERQRFQLEKQLRQSQKMEALGTLSSGMAHDFNNLLQALSGLTQLMFFKTSKYPEISNYLERMEGIIARGGDLIKSLLGFSHMSDSSFKAVDLNLIVTDSFNIFSRTLDKATTINTNVLPESLAIKGDFSQLEQVILNIVNNAQYALKNHKDPKIDMTTSKFTVDQSNLHEFANLMPGDFARVSIFDNGCGIPPEIIEHIFDPFFTTKGIGKGTGLGLSMAYGIIKSHSGDIKCVSAPGHGTRFDIFLPLTKELPESTKLNPLKRPVKDVQEEGSANILIVDDEQIIRESLKEALEMNSYNVLQAENGEEGLSIVAAHDVKAIILDLGMPGMGGEVFLKTIREMGVNAPVIVASGHAGHPIAVNPVKFGASLFLHKPYRFNKLLETVEMLLSPNN